MNNEPTPAKVRLTEGLGPTAWRCEWNGDNDSSGWDQWHDDSDPLPEKWEGTPPDKVTAFYDAATVCQMIEAARCVNEQLHTFLNAAAGEGLVLDGVDAADLYVALFPERYAAAIARLGA